MSDELEQLKKENNYYRKRVDELAATNLKLDVSLSDVRYALIQKQKGFALLSKLQTFATSAKDPSSILRNAIDTVSSTLSVERTVALTPVGVENRFAPSQWVGYKDDEAEPLRHVVLEFPPEFSTGNGLLMVNKATPPTPLIESIRAALNLPYFVAVPVAVDNAPIGIIVSGRLRENRPLWPPFDEGDIHTFQSLAGFIASSIQILRVGALQETDRLKTEFFANISHEFRTPITLTVGPLQSLLSGRYGALSDAVQKQAETMLRNQHRLLGLINQILDLAKAEAGELKVKPVRVKNFNEIIERTLLQFQSMAEGRGLELKSRLDPKVSASDVYVDPDLMDKLLFNLLSNAHKFTKKGHIEVVTEFLDNQLRVWVNDTGIGIKADQLPYIFDRFRQADGSTSREYAGTGIGLSLVKQIVTLHHGELKVLSEYGKGSTFRFTLPLGKDHFEPGTVIEQAEALSEQGPAQQAVDYKEGGGRDQVEAVNLKMAQAVDERKPTVVYADDNADLRAYVRDLLLPHYNVFLGADGEQALEVARVHRPDLILSDLMMPRMTGTDLCKAVRLDAALRTTPFVLLTAKSNTDSRIGGLEDGADDYLNKPFVEQELLARVRNLIALRKHQARLKQELLAARDIQRLLLPPPVQRLKGATLEALYKPCDELSGDFYDVFVQDPWVYWYLADVTSHGTAAAQVTYLVKGMFSEALARMKAPSLPELTEKVSATYVGYGLPYDVGIQVIRFHVVERRLEYLRSGAPSAALIRKGEFHLLNPKPGQLLKGKASKVIPAESLTVELQADDQLFMFTDGCYELEQPNGKQLGIKRLLSIFKDAPVDTWKDVVLQKLAEASGRPDFEDDLSILRLRMAAPE